MLSDFLPLKPSTSLNLCTRVPSRTLALRIEQGNQSLVYARVSDGYKRVRGYRPRRNTILQKVGLRKRGYTVHSLGNGR